MRRLRIITYNIAHGRGLSLYQGITRPVRVRYNLLQIARLLRTYKADVAALQEVDFDSHWNGRFDLLEYLRDKGGFRYAYAGVTTQRAGKKPLNYGNGILSKKPLALCGNHPFGTAHLGEKGFLYAQIDLGAALLPLVNLHLDFRSRTRRLRQLGQVMRFMENAPSDADKRCLSPIVCGDFNVSLARRADAVRTLLQFLRKRGDYALFPERGRTFPSVMPARRLDFCFVPAPLQVLSCSVLPSRFSDHRPVVLELGIAE